jgi:hypothetical protein
MALFHAVVLLGLEFFLVAALLVGALFFERLRQKAFWLPAVIILAGHVIIHIATNSYLGLTNSWIRNVPGLSIIFGYMMTFLSLLPAAIWWGIRRFEYERSFGPLILWIFTFLFLIVFDQLTSRF